MHSEAPSLFHFRLRTQPDSCIQFRPQFLRIFWCQDIQHCRNTLLSFPKVSAFRTLVRCIPRLVWRTGLTSRSCKKRFSCTWDSLSKLELSSFSSEPSCGTNRLCLLDVEPSGNASSPTVTAQVAGISESLPCSSTWRKSEHVALDGFKMRSTVFTRGVSCMKAQVACKAEIYRR